MIKKSMVKSTVPVFREQAPLFFVLVCLLAVFWFFPISVFGTQQAPVLDYIELLTSSEVTKLQEEIQKLEVTTEFQIGVVIYGESGLYSDLLSYIKYTVGPKYFSNNRCIIAMNLQEREMVMEVSGTAKELMSDSDINRILDVVAPYFTKNDYYSGFEKFLYLVEEEVANPTATVDVSEVNEQKVMVIFFSVIMSLTVAGATTYFFYQGMNTVRTQDSATGYLDRSEFLVTHDREQYLSRHVTRTPRQQNQSSGGGSRVHGGGGRSSGGGSRRF